MGLDNSTLFIANISILLVSVAAYGSVWLRAKEDRFWLTWAGANLLLAGALIIYLTMPRLPPHLAVWPNGLLIAGFCLRHAATRQFGKRAVGSLFVWLPAPAFVAIALMSGSQGLNYALANTVLTMQAGLVAYEFWRDRSDRLPSRFGLVAAYGLMAASFGVRAGQGFLANDQIVSYIPYDTLLQLHLVVALVHIAAGNMFVLSLASEQSANALRRAALLDPLTGLHNRRAFDCRLHELVEHPDLDDFAVALLDLDHFKSINDRHGHAAGDAVLRSVADSLMQALRPTDFVARIGGEEFAVIFRGVQPNQAFQMAEQLRTAVKNARVDHKGRQIAVTASGGVCHSSAAECDFDRMLELADRELYRAKFIGRDRTSQAATSSVLEEARPDATFADEAPANVKWVAA